MALTLGSVEPARTSPWLWFVAAGTAAVLIGVIAAYVIHAPLWFIYSILPTSMLLFDPSPADFATEVFQFFILFGGTFVIYGTAGWFVGNAIQGLRSWRHSRSRQL
jgi:hypothetical protein